MVKRRLFLVRHCQSVGNEKKIVDSIGRKFDELSKKGKKEAKELAKKLKDYEIDVVITSPLKRTKQTMDPFLKENHWVKHIINKSTIERDAGEFTGKPVHTIRDYRKKLSEKEKISFRPKEGESILDVYKRAEKFLNYLKKNFKTENILICGHKNFLMCLEIALTNKKIEDYYSYSFLKNKELRKFKL